MPNPIWIRMEIITDPKHWFYVKYSRKEILFLCLYVGSVHLQEAERGMGARFWASEASEAPLNNCYYICASEMLKNSLYGVMVDPLKKF